MSSTVIPYREPIFSHDIINSIRDREALHDALRREAMVHAIVSEITSADQGNSPVAFLRPPRVIGVYGAWGSGKSYLLSLIIKHLEKLNQDPTQPVRTIICPFQTWKYEVEGTLTFGLIRTLRDLYTLYSAQNVFLRNSRAIMREAEGLLKLMAEVFLQSGHWGPGLLAGGIKVFIDQVLHGDDAGDIQARMQRLVNAILASPADRRHRYRLVIFIDDLDRCSPENMVNMFEWLKVHLDVEGVTYVLALDHVAAARAIVGAYKTYLGEDQDLAYGFRYLEKLVESEYELEEASLVEQMAIHDIVRDEARHRYSRVREIAETAHGSEFPGIQYIDELINMRSLRVPRTMLKIVLKFVRALNLISRAEDRETVGRLPSSYPFWTLLIACMYYRLGPDTLGDFVDGRGEFYALLSHSLESDEIPKGWQSGPMREFWQFGVRLVQTGGSAMELPRKEVLQTLTSIIRENTASVLDNHHRHSHHRVVSHAD